MAPILFTRAIDEGLPIQVFNHGNHSRDFTFIDDVVEGAIRASDRPATPARGWDSNNPDPATSNAPFRLYNIGNSKPVRLNDFIASIEAALGKTAVRELLPLQPGDAPDTFADVTDLAKAVDYAPTTSTADGVNNLVAWYRDYYRK